MIFEKWYGDVFSGGRLQIYYRANLTLGPVVIGYRGCLSNEGRTLSRISLGGIPLPCIEGGALTVEAAEDDCSACGSVPN